MHILRIPALVSAIAICLPAVFATEALQGNKEEAFEGALQDLKLLFSFAVGILFVRSMELAVDSGEAREGQRSKRLELYPFLT
mmetsp:Transcript_110509/g.155108  ORF Transcript_110509/g.155108 Transcript_110509/m.155108 type:complete len:83 (+) Transcript_110509:66-314(+)